MKQAFKWNSPALKTQKHLRNDFRQSKLQYERYRSKQPQHPITISRQKQFTPAVKLKERSLSRSKGQFASMTMIGRVSQMPSAMSIKNSEMDVSVEKKMLLIAKQIKSMTYSLHKLMDSVKRELSSMFSELMKQFTQQTYDLIYFREKMLGFPSSEAQESSEDSILTEEKLSDKKTCVEITPRTNFQQSFVNFRSKIMGSCENISESTQNIPSTKGKVCMVPNLKLINITKINRTISSTSQPQNSKLPKSDRQRSTSNRKNSMEKQMLRMNGALTNMKNLLSTTNQPNQ